MAIFRVMAMARSPILYVEGTRHLVPFDLVGFVEFRTVGLKRSVQVRRAHELARAKYPEAGVLMVVLFPPSKSLWRVLTLTEEGFEGLGHLEAPGNVTEEEVLAMASECWEMPESELSVMQGAG